MTNKIQTHVSSKVLLCVIALAAVIALSMSACKKKEHEEGVKLSGTITADSNGVVTFMYSQLSNKVPDQCSFTTNLPAPNDKFILTVASGESTAERGINGLASGQEVEWTAIVEGKPGNTGSGNFVHIVNN
jgi:hypothetical protein